MLAFLAQVAQPAFDRPHIDWHAFAPELILLAWGALVTIVDLVGLERTRRFMPGLTGIGFLLAMIPILTLWAQGDAFDTLEDELLTGDVLLACEPSLS